MAEINWFWQWISVNVCFLLGNADLWISFCLLNSSVLVIRLKKIPHIFHVCLALLRKVSNSLFLSIDVVLLFNFVVCCRFSPMRSLYCRDPCHILWLWPVVGSTIDKWCFFCVFMRIVQICAGIDQYTILKSIFVRVLLVVLMNGWKLLYFDILCFFEKFIRIFVRNELIDGIVYEMDRRTYPYEVWRFAKCNTHMMKSVLVKLTKYLSHNQDFFFPLDLRSYCCLDVWSSFSFSYHIMAVTLSFFLLWLFLCIIFGCLTTDTTTIWLCKGKN